MANPCHRGYSLSSWLLLVIVATPCHRGYSLSSWRRPRPPTLVLAEVPFFKGMTKSGEGLSSWLIPVIVATPCHRGEGHDLHPSFSKGPLLQEDDEEWRTPVIVAKATTSHPSFSKGPLPQGDDEKWRTLVIVAKATTSKF